MCRTSPSQSNATCARPNSMSASSLRRYMDANGAPFAEARPIWMANPTPKRNENMALNLPEPNRLTRNSAVRSYHAGNNGLSPLTPYGPRKLWRLITPMPSSANPRRMSSSAIRSLALIGPRSIGRRRRPASWGRRPGARLARRFQGSLRRRAKVQGQLLIGRSRAQSLASFDSLCSMASVRASQLASMMFSLTPTVPHTESESLLSITTRTLAAVPAHSLITRTL